MELCEHYLHYMSALCEGTMPAPLELALTADTTEERAAQLQSALKDLSVPDFVRLCAKSAGDELDEAIFDHFSEEDFSRALLQMLTAAAEPEEVEEKPPAAESAPDPDTGKHAFEVFCDCVATPMALHQMPLANSDVLTNVPMPVLFLPMSAMRMPDRNAELVAMSPKA